MTMQKKADPQLGRPEDRVARTRSIGARRQHHVLWGVAAAQCQLLLNSDFPHALQAALRTLGKALGADRAFVARRRVSHAGLPALTCVASWQTALLARRADVTFESHALFAHYPTWDDGLSSGEVAAFPTRPGAGRPLDGTGVKSYLFAPIMSGGAFWGVLGIEHVFSRVLWTANDESIFTSLSMGIGGAIEKHNTANRFAPVSGGPEWIVEEDDSHLVPLAAHILNQVSEAILAVDPAGVVTYFNQGAEIIFGLSAREAVGAPYASLVRQRNTSFETDPAIRAEIERKGIWTGRDTLVLRDWRTRQVTLSVTPLREAEAHLGLIVVLRDVLRDVTANRQQELRIEHRLRVESALVEASQQLVSGGQVDFEQLLGLMGEAVGAETVYFVEIPSDRQLTQEPPEVLQALSQPRVWEKPSGELDLPPLDFGPAARLDARRLVCKWNGTRLSRASKPGAPTALAVPVLSPQGKLHGYLGVEYGGRPPEWREADSRVLSVLGDLLSTYFERKISEEALRESEERYRTFVDTTSEAIWRIELGVPLATTAPVAEQVAAFCEWAELAECNRVMAVLLGYPEPDTLLERRLSQVMPNLEVALVEEFVRSEYRLHNHEYSAACQGKTVRHFVINAVGTLKEGALIRVWGSCVEVTERVMLERQMVEALEEQQQRIGRDLHDGVGQLLTGVRMLSQNLAEKLAEQEDESAVQARKVSGFAEQASRRVREIYRGLTPTQLFYEGLATALGELAHNTNGLPGIACSFVTDGSIDVWEKETKMHLYRIAQEAVNNALKHAQASEILLSLSARGNDIELRIEDNGLGFDPSVRTGKSLGLNSMDYRARTIKGRFEITSEPGKGTRVRCVIHENLLKHALTRFA
jgi:PAS domain S-box-containing protein